MFFDLADARFEVMQKLSHTVHDRPQGSQMFQDQIFDVFRGHPALPVGLPFVVYHLSTRFLLPKGVPSMSAFDNGIFR